MGGVKFTVDTRPGLIHDGRVENGETDMRRYLTAAADDVRCQHTIRWTHGETAQCRRAKVSGPYCAQHAKMAAVRVEAGRRVIAEMKRKVK